MIKQIITGALLCACLGTSVSFAQTNELSIISPTPTLPTNIACVKTAVDAREASIGTAWTTYSTAMTTALSARRTALATAWGTADAKTRRSLRADAWKAYRESSRSAHTTLKTARKTAWDAYKTASRACGVQAVEAQGADTTGTIGL